MKSGLECSKVDYAQVIVFPALSCETPLFCGYGYGIWGRMQGCVKGCMRRLNGRVIPFRQRVAALKRLDYGVSIRTVEELREKAIRTVQSIMSAFISLSLIRERSFQRVSPYGVTTFTSE
jgi:hypothetical protein